MFLIFIYSKVIIFQEKYYIVIWGCLVYFATCIIGPQSAYFLSFMFIYLFFFLQIFSLSLIALTWELYTVVLFDANNIHHKPFFYTFLGTQRNVANNEKLPNGPEINLEIACHTLTSTTKIKCVVNTKESGHYELFPMQPTESS